MESVPFHTDFVFVVAAVAAAVAAAAAPVVVVNAVRWLLILC